jgi:hypothetical protein
MRGRRIEKWRSASRLNSERGPGNSSAADRTDRPLAWGLDFGGRYSGICRCPLPGSTVNCVAAAVSGT